MVISQDNIEQSISDFRQALYIFQDKQEQGLVFASTDLSLDDPQRYQCYAYLPGIYPEWLGDHDFLRQHNVRYPYVGGEMARGIASAELVIALAESGMLGFFGAAGLSIADVEKNIVTIKQALDPKQLSYGVNLIHSPDQPELEAQLVELFFKHQVTRISASAFMDLSKHVVHYAYKGIHIDQQGNIIKPHHVFAKVSRPEVAMLFMKPAPDTILDQLVSDGLLTSDEAQLAKQLPIAEDITAEADSGGHTDNRPLTALFPRLVMLRDDIQAQYDYPYTIRIGAAGGLGSPEAIAAAFALGAAYVLLGTVHQATVQSGLSMIAKHMLVDADIADITMAPAADMFERGVKVQVLKKGTMMGGRANQLYELYRRYNAIEEIPEDTRKKLEASIFLQPLDAIWQETQEYFTQVEPLEVTRAEKDSKYKMSLIFRWYLGKTSRWPLVGDESRKMDYQIWCGPAIGSFNAWTKGSFLDIAENRDVRQVSLNLLEGAAQITRAQQLRSLGIAVPASIFAYKPQQFALNMEQKKVS